MKYQFLNKKNLIMGKIGNLFNLFSKKDRIFPSDGDYKLLKNLTPSYTKEANRVGIYSEVGGDKVIIKRHRYSYFDLDYFYLLNEASILKYLGSLNMDIKIFPELVRAIITKKEIQIIMEFIKSPTIDKLNKEIRIAAVKKTLFSLKQLSDKISRNHAKDMAIPERSYYSYLLSFFISLLKVIIKNPQLSGRYLKFTFLFYFNYIIGNFRKYENAIVHRDLGPENIAYSVSKNEIILLDWEGAVISDPLYDLAQIVIKYHLDLGEKETIGILNRYLGNDSQRRRYLGLSIYNCIQRLGNSKKGDKVFEEANAFLNYLVKNIIPEVMLKRSVFEIINSLTLDIVSWFYKLTKLNKYSLKTGIVLSYHSVGDNTGWCFSTKINEFKEQLAFLKNNYKFKTLIQIMDGEPGVNISFDDGYLDVYENVLPILEKEGITATMFVLGDYTKADRVQLDNNLPIMNFEQIKKLHKKGWEIGYHTKTHANIGYLLENELNEEIVESKEEVEIILGFKLKYFAYPKGKYSNKIIRYVQKAGFEAAFTVDAEPIKLNDKMRLGRIPMEVELHIEQFESLLSPIGLRISNFYMAILKLKGLKNA